LITPRLSTEARGALSPSKGADAGTVLTEKLDSFVQVGGVKTSSEA
jgi:hypothetical protein